MKRNLAGASLVVLASCAALAQSNPPTFEVASIKAAAPQTNGRVMVRMGSDPGRVDYANVSLKDVLARAYNLKRYQVSGPDWLDSERYDITAKVPEGVAKEQVPVMLQALLADRFKMSIHKDSKEEAVYSMVTGKNGPKLKKSEEDENAAAKVITTPEGARINALKGGMMVTSSPGGTASLRANRVTMAQFADMLSNMLDRPVLDMTGIEGNYDVAIDVSMEEMAGMRKGMMRAGPGPMVGAPGGGDHGPAPDGAPSASIFTSIQQLGLKLEPRKAPVEHIVVDKADRIPTEN